MTRSRRRGSYASSALALLGLGCATARHDRVIVPDLASITTGVGWRVQDRNASVVAGAGGIAVLHLDEWASEGVAWLEGFQFTEGAIELDVRGRDVFQRSFVGIAFHGVDAVTYDAVYFRPFNFRTDDPVRGGHAVQYISHPTHTWRTLREQYPGRFEQPVHPSPDPTAWFHARVEIRAGVVRVFVDRAPRPSLIVRQLSQHSKGRVGLFVGEGSGGDFANLRIVAWR